MKKITACTLFFTAFSVCAGKHYNLVSPDGRLMTDISVGKELTYSVSLDGKTVIADSPLSMTLGDGTTWGDNGKVTSFSRKSVDTVIDSPFYRAEKMQDKYNAASIDFKGGWGIEFRLYNDGIAYRFTSSRKEPVIIADENVTYNFLNDATAYAGYTISRSSDPCFTSFENEYAKVKLSETNPDKLIFLPMTVDLGNNLKVTITESDLEQFPGLYMAAGGGTSLKGTHAGYPKKSVQGGHNNLQMIVTEREDYIAKSAGSRTYPWRIAIITDNDRDLAASNLSYLLASPSRIADTSWIKPGKVAWEWWNDWNITGVDFEAGVNNETYKKYHWRLLKSVNAKLLNSVFMLVTRFSGLQTLSHFSNDYIGVGDLKLGSPIFHECRTIHF